MYNYSVRSKRLWRSQNWDIKHDSFNELYASGVRLNIGGLYKHFAKLEPMLKGTVFLVGLVYLFDGLFIYLPDN